MTTDTLHHEHHDEVSAKVTMGFWTYIMTDFIMFAGLFATYVVLRPNTYGSVGIGQIANLPFQFGLTMLMLLSSLTYGFAFSNFHKGSFGKLCLWLVVTFILGLAFVRADYHHLNGLVQMGFTWKTSAFLSSYFTLITIFLVHMVVALVWVVVLLIQLRMQGLSSIMKTRFTCLSLFWNYLSLVWIFIFTIVYLMGAI